MQAKDSTKSKKNLISSNVFLPAIVSCDTLLQSLRPLQQCCQLKSLFLEIEISYLTCKRISFVTLIPC